MAKKNAKNTQAEAIVETVVEQVVEAVEAPAVPEGPKNTILFIASRGTGKKFTWYQIPVDGQDELVKVKGCAAQVPIQVAEVIGTNKFVSWIDQALIEKSVEEQKVVRGMASTFSDVFARYIKVNEIKGADKVATVLEVFKGIIEAINNGEVTGGWERPEPEKEAEAPTEPEVQDEPAA